MFIGVVCGLAVGYLIHADKSPPPDSTRMLQDVHQPPVVTYQPGVAGTSAAEEEEEDGAGAERRKTGPSETDIYLRDERERKMRAAEAAARYPRLHVPGYRFVGAGHLKFDVPKAAQPGNVTPAECAAVCERQSGCHSFAFFPKPSWSQVSECYLKSSRGACPSQLEPAAPNVAFTWQSIKRCSGDS